MHLAHVLYTQLMHSHMWHLVSECEVPNNPYVHKDCRSKGYVLLQWPGVRFPSLLAFACVFPTCFANHTSPRCHLSHFLHIPIELLTYWLTNTFLTIISIVRIIIWTDLEVFQSWLLNTVFTFNIYTPWQWDVRYSICCTHTYTSWYWKHNTTVHAYCMHMHGKQYYICILYMHSYAHTKWCSNEWNYLYSWCYFTHCTYPYTHVFNYFKLVHGCIYSLATCGSSQWAGRLG